MKQIKNTKNPQNLNKKIPIQTKKSREKSKFSIFFYLKKRNFFFQKVWKSFKILYFFTHKKRLLS